MGFTLPWEKSHHFTVLGFYTQIFSHIKVTVLIRVIVPGRLIHHSDMIAMRFNLTPNLTIRSVLVTKICVPISWLYETLFLQLSVLVLSNNVVRQKLFSVMINETYITNGEYSQCLCFDDILFILISTYGYGSVLPKLLSNPANKIKKLSVQNSEMKTKEAIAKHKPFCILTQPNQYKQS